MIAKLKTRLARAWRKIKPKKSLVSKRHDFHVIKQARKRRFPSIKQLLHCKRCFSSKEMTVMRTSMLLLVVGLVWGTVTVMQQYRSEVPAIGGKYIEAIVGEIERINPLFASTNDVDSDITHLVYSGLMRYDNEQNLVPDLAERVEISDDQLTYTFYLRENITWHDGEVFSADDVVFTFDTIVDEEVGSPLRVTFQGIGINSPDERTVVFTLEEPFTPFLSSLTVGIVPAHIWGDMSPERIRLAEANVEPVGTGPYRVKKFTKDDTGYISRYELTRSESYHLKTAFIEDVIFQFYADYGTDTGAIHALRQGNVDGLHFVPTDLKEQTMRKHIMLHTLQLPQYTALFFNQDKEEALQTKEVRMALANALDKDRILREGLGGEGDVIYSPILPGFPGYSNSIEKTPFDAIKANEYLDEAEWEQVPAEEYIDSILKAQVSERIKIEGLTTSTPEVTNTTSTTSTPELPEINVEERIAEITEEIKTQIEATFNPAQTFYRQKDDQVLMIDLVTADTAEYRQAAGLIAGFWQELGILTNIEFVPARDMNREVLKSRDYDVLLYGYIIGSDPDQYPFWHSSQIDFPGLNFSRYVNREADTALENAREATSTQAVATAVESFQTLLLEDMPAVFLYTPTYTYATTDNVHGISLSRIFTPSDRFADITNWYVQTKRVWKK